MLVCLAIAGDRSLDLSGCVLVDRHAGASQCEQHDPPRMAKLGGSLWIFVKKQGFYSRSLWLVRREHVEQRSLDCDQAMRQVKLSRRGDHAVSDVNEPHALASNNPPAEVSSPRVDSQDQHLPLSSSFSAGKSNTLPDITGKTAGSTGRRALWNRPLAQPRTQSTRSQRPPRLTPKGRKRPGLHPKKRRTESLRPGPADKVKSGPETAGTQARRSAPLLSTKQKAFLRGLAHGLEPIVQIGKGGATEALLAELERALEVHELLKIRIGGECPDDAKSVISTVESATNCVVVQEIGHVLVAYRPRAVKPVIELPVAPQRAR